MEIFFFHAPRFVGRANGAGREQLREGACCAVLCRLVSCLVVLCRVVLCCVCCNVVSYAMNSFGTQQWRSIRTTAFEQEGEARPSSLMKWKRFCSGWGGVSYPVPSSFCFVRSMAFRILYQVVSFPLFYAVPTFVEFQRSPVMWQL